VALVYTVAKPARLIYGQSELSATDYPDLIEQGKPISTLSVRNRPGCLQLAYWHRAVSQRRAFCGHFFRSARRAAHVTLSSKMARDRYPCFRWGMDAV